MNATSTIPDRATESNSLAAQVGWALTDAWTITLRDLQHWRHQPGAVLVGWLFPIMIVLMFGWLFGGAIQMPPGQNYIDFLVPGMFATTMFFGIEATMVAVATDAAKGVTDRFRSLPTSASAVVLGRCLADMLNATIGLAIMIGAGLLLGWRWHGSLLAAAAAVGLLLLLRFALLWVGIYLGLASKGPESIASVQTLIWPVNFLSSVYVDPASMPGWLSVLAQWNPLSATASAARDLFMNPNWQLNTWMAENAVLMAVVWPVLLTLIFFPLSVKKFRELRQ